MIMVHFYLTILGEVVSHIEVDLLSPLALNADADKQPCLHDDNEEDGYIVNRYGVENILVEEVADENRPHHGADEYLHLWEQVLIELLAQIVRG